MKKTLLSIVTILCVLVAFGVNSPKEKTMNTENTAETIVMGSEFNEGFKDGYCEGWKDVKGQYAICPITPIPPIPPIGKDTYRGGYNLGFKKGMRAAQRD